MDFPDDINVLHLIIIISSPLVKIFFPKVPLILHAKIAQLLLLVLLCALFINSDSIGFTVKKYIVNVKY